MRKWDIEIIESRLEKKLRRNFVTIGLDIAKQVTGYSVLKANTKSLYLYDSGIIDTSKCKTTTDALKTIKQSLSKIKVSNIQQKACIVEMPFVGYNRWGAIMLGLSAGCAWCKMEDYLPYTFFLSAKSARSRVGFKKGANEKGKTKELAQKYILQVFDYQEDENIVDGFILALAGLIDLDRV
jgi:Holliday junction resolvasome RuvABC endonuclease subunit